MAGPVMVCPRCGTVVAVGAAWCGKCGLPRGASATPPTATPPAPAAAWGTVGVGLTMQCPNCGGYKTFRNKHKFDENEYKLLFCVLVGWIVFYITIPVMILWYLRFKSNHSVCAQCLYGYKCGLCGCQWFQRPGEILPVNNNPAARAFGQAKLDEEEARARAAAYWYSQHR